jgi:hypothetical protein
LQGILHQTKRELRLMQSIQSCALRRRCLEFGRHNRELVGLTRLLHSYRRLLLLFELVHGVARFPLGRIRGVVLPQCFVGIGNHRALDGKELWLVDYLFAVQAAGLLRKEETLRSKYVDLTEKRLRAGEIPLPDLTTARIDLTALRQALSGCRGASAYNARRSGCGPRDAGIWINQ